MLERARGIVKDVFGYDGFRPLQEEVIAAIMAKRDALVVMPTGGGKSLCYQVPALASEGLTVVVSPLISLMKDQVDQLRALGVDAVLLNSTLSAEEYAHNTAMVRAGTARLLYIAPESLMKREVLSLLESARVECLAIDEAHCISEWGHDFRPEYRQLSAIRKRFPSAACAAFTATATVRVRDDIKRTLLMDGTAEFVASFNRENLFFEVSPKQEPLSQILDFLEKNRGSSGIIYCFSRNQVDLLAGRLAGEGYSVRPYHAGLADEVRRENQELFIRDDVQIMVATIAFGMGIHKTNVRFVIHFDLPKSIESYYQEIGRAGRDGLPAHCLLLYGYGDTQKIRYFIGQKSDEMERRVADAHLEALVRYAEHDGCRRAPLLAHFGEEYAAGNCGMCDNCVTPRERGEDLTTRARMFLSCVARTGRRFGAEHIIDVLRGSESRKVLDNDHHRISTYGIGKDLPKADWQAIARRLVSAGALFRDPERHGGLDITEKGMAIMRGDESFYGSIRAKASSRTHGDRCVDYDETLFELLRAKRKELATAENVPPYVVFSDKTLADMASRYPQSRESMLAVHGVGARKLARYGDEFAGIIAAYCRERGLDDRCAGAPSRRDPLKTPRFVTVGEEYNAGKSVDELAAGYGVKTQTILNNLFSYLREGHSLRSDGIIPLLSLDAKRGEAVLGAFEELGAEYLKPVFERLNGEISYETLAVYRLYVLAGKTESDGPAVR